MNAGRERSSLLESFSYAFQGMVYVLRYQRNMQIHFGLAVLVLVASLFFGLSRLELVAVFFAISLVLVAEMLNTALENAIDLTTSSYDPKAKIAKDVAAGAVLVAAINSLVVAYFVFANKAASVSVNVLSKVRNSPEHLTFIALLLVVLLVIALKARKGTLRHLSGGLPSGHAAVAFAGWTAVTFIAAGTRYGFLISALTFFMAVLTAQSRVEAHIHSTAEVAFGAILGILVATIVFQLWY